MEVILYVILFVYALTLLLLVKGIEKLGFFKPSLIHTFQKFTVVVVYRNENHHLSQLLHSIEKLNYSKENFELLMINDGSTESFDFSKYDLPIRLISNKRYSNSPKKDAITIAVEEAKHEWLVVTDADCEVPEMWLSKLNDFIAQTPFEMVCGPVFINNNEKFIHHFQAWDFVSLQLVTVGSFGLGKPFVCNGANMAFTKSIFVKVDGYQDNNHLPSGDDVFLLQKIVKNDKNKVGYLLDEDFIVKTAALDSWQSVINQRIRWGGKAKSYQSLWGLYLSVLTLVISLLTVWQFFKLNFVFLFLKFLVDAIVLIYFSKKMKQSPKCLFKSILFYPFVIFIIFIKSLFFRVSWKN